MSSTRLMGLALFIAACATPVAPPSLPSNARAIDPRAPSASPPSDSDAAREDDSAIPITANDPTWGSRRAFVTIVEFADFECIFCRRAEETIDKLRKAYGPDTLRLVWKHMPLTFHPHARRAAEASQGVFALGGNDAFWRFHALAFERSANLPESFDELARGAGVDVASFRSGVASGRWTAAVDADAALAERLGVEGTPHFLVNGISVSGAQPFKVFQPIIDGEIAKAKSIAEKGAPRDRIYAILTAYNLKNPAPVENEEEEDTTTVWKVPVGTSPARGSSTALVTIVEFSDFQCPYCANVEPTLDRIRATYGDRVRLVWKNEPLPFHPRAEPAAELALEARAEKGDVAFWDAHDRLYATQAHLEDADLERIAVDMHLDAAAVAKAREKHKYRARIDDDLDLSDDVQANGTPHFFINGRRLMGSQPFERFQPIIDEEIAKAKALLDKGIAPAVVYDELTRAGRFAPPPEKIAVAPAPNAPTRGSAKATVTLEEFADFQCGFCGRAEDTLKEVMTSYAGRVKLVWRNLPIPGHPDAPLAAEAALEAYKQKGADGFWKMHDLLFANQKTGGGLGRAALDGYAAELGLDRDKWKRALDGEEHKGEILADAKAADDAKITGTPFFIVNGYVIRGAQPYAKFRRLIERALAEKR